MTNSAINDQTVLHTLSTLETELLERIGKLTLDLTQTHSADSGEQAVERENDEVLLQLKQDAVDELQQIQTAKQRVEQGRYQQCQRCGNTIPVKRLLAIPYTTLCVTCSESDTGE